MGPASSCRCASVTHTHTQSTHTVHTHTHSLTHTQSLSLSLSLSHTHTLLTQARVWLRASAFGVYELRVVLRDAGAGGHAGEPYTDEALPEELLSLVEVFGPSECSVVCV